MPHIMGTRSYHIIPCQTSQTVRKIMELLCLLLYRSEIRVSSYWFNTQDKTKNSICHYKWKMALECSPIQNLLSTMCILLHDVTSIIRVRPLFNIPWWHINVQGFVERTLAALANCFQLSKSSKFENETQQMPVFQATFTLFGTFNLRTRHAATTRKN